MFYTITFNPAIDLVMRVPHVQIGELNRSQGESYVVGGKGINMSYLLNHLGKESVATGFLAGFTGRYIREELDRVGIEPYFIEVSGMTRINVKIKSQEESEINAAGPFVSYEEFSQLVEFFEQNITKSDVVMLAGNAAPGMNSSAYVRIAELCQQKGCLFVLDATKDLLTKCLPYHPFIVKPNHRELGEIFGVAISKESELVFYARELQKLGARNVLVSRGSLGALLLTETGAVFLSNIPSGKLVNSVGAGDSMLAGFMAEFTETHDYQSSLLQAAAAGSATAFSMGIAKKDLIDELKSQIQVRRWNDELGIEEL